MALFELTGTLDESVALELDRWFEERPECIVTLMESAGVAPRFGEPGHTPDPADTLWSRCDVSVLVDETDHDPFALAETLQTLFGVSLVAAPVTDAEKDWQAHYRAQVSSLAFPGGLKVTPPWEAPREAEPLTLILEPDQAFGSGRHPTTRMCLDAMAAPDGVAHRMLAHAAVLDWGCGSAILAMAAVRLGAARADAVDIDPVALECAARNLAVNGLENRIALHLPEGAPGQTYDLVVANILLNPLCELASRLTARLRPNGLLLLTGLLADQAEQCIAAYPRVGLEVAARDGDWVLLAGRLRAQHADPVP